MATPRSASSRSKRSPDAHSAVGELSTVATIAHAHMAGRPGYACRAHDAWPGPPRPKSSASCCKLALHNAGRSVSAQVIVVGFIVWLGWRAGAAATRDRRRRRSATSAPPGAGGWRAATPTPTRLDERRRARAPASLEGNAAMAGAFWVVSVVGIYAHQSRQRGHRLHGDGLRLDRGRRLLHVAGRPAPSCCWRCRRSAR